MKKTAIILGAIFLYLSSHVFANDAGFTIEKYHVDMVLQKDGSMQVTENILVNFSIDSRGIFRQIPIKDTAGDYIHIKDITVVGDPIASLTIANNNYDVKIGDPYVYIIGPKQYTIRYNVLNAIKAFSETATGSSTTGKIIRQELYRNVIGTQRPTSIGNSTYTIRIPEENQFDKNSMFVVWGSQGQQNSQGALIEQIDTTTIQGNITNILQPGQGATIGLKFPSGYFVAKSDYNTLFSKEPSLGIWESIKRFFGQGISGIFYSISKFFKSIVGWQIDEIVPILFWIIVIFSGFFHKSRGSVSGRKPAWKSTKAITPYYTPPKNIEPATGFWLWYNAQNPQIFVALLYYWATKGWVEITLTEGKKYFFGGKAKDVFVISEKIENPADATDLDKKLLHEFFGTPDNTLDKVKLTENSYSKMTRVLSDLEETCDADKKLYKREKSWFSKKYTLTFEGEQLFEEMRGYKAYLEKVERPVIEKELKNDPIYLNKILPWAVLFGTETRLLQLCEDLIAQADWYHSYDNTGLNAARFASMTNSIKSSVIAPRPSGSSGSGFGSGFGGGGGGGGFSGGGGGGGGGGRW